MFKRKKPAAFLADNVSVSHLKTWLEQQYDFEMSATAAQLFHDSLKSGNPFHLMQWSERGDIFLRLFKDEAGLVTVQYQFSFAVPGHDGWRPITTLADEMKLEEGEANFHVFCGIRRELSKSLVLDKRRKNPVLPV